MFKNKINRRIKNNDDRIDWGIIFSVLILSVIGMMSIYVAVTHDTSNTSVVRTMFSQTLWYILGIIAIVVIMQFDAEQLWKIAPIAYGIGLILLILLLFLYSRSYAAQTGAKSWFAFGSLTFQPSEIMKPAYILMLARVIAEHNSEYSVHTLRQDWNLIGKLFLWTLPIVVLLKLENDFGTTLVFIAILCGMIIISGVSWKIILPVFGVGILLGGLAIFLVIYDRTILLHLGFQNYQFARVDAWLHPQGNTNGSSFQLWKSMVAIGSGQLFGKGFDVAKVYVPVRESDMIFSVIGEDFGFVGSCVLIFIYLLLIFQMVQVTFDTKNKFYAYISTGVIMMILFHVFENIGMCIGLLPLTGIPLPFISQGGSALIGNMIGVGMIMSMRYHHKSYMFSNYSDFH